MQKKVLVTGSSGFIGGHLVRKLKKEGCVVVGIDMVEPKYERPNYFHNMDLRLYPPTDIFSFYGRFDEVYNLGCLMGGMGYIGDSSKSYDIMVGSTQIVANVLECCVRHKVGKLFYSSSACVYNMNLQDKEDSAALKEKDSYPAMPDLVYGWQKLMSEIMIESAAKQFGLDVRIARFHNIFGTEGVWMGGKEKAPAALCRKIAQAKDGDSIIVWGDGSQRRSFMYIDECLDAVDRLMYSVYTKPINIGSGEDVSIKELAEMIIKISGKKLSIEYDITKPQGVRGRNSDNTLINEVMGWQPSQKLYDGLAVTYEFINNQINKNDSQGTKANATEIAG